MNSLWDIIPDAKVLLAFQPEELGRAVMTVFLEREKRREPLHIGNFLGEFEDRHGNPYPSQGVRSHEVQQAVAEAIGWLQSSGLVVQDPRQDTGWIKVSRRGNALRDEASFANYRKSRLLPREVLHPKLQDQVWLAFLRGDYATAVFQAFKEVEVSVRDAANLTHKDIGVALMRKAFEKGGGALTDMSAEEGEREALSHLFAGAIGSYKNPHSHRTVTIEDAQDAFEMVIVASHLLRIIDARGSGATSAARDS